MDRKINQLVGACHIKVNSLVSLACRWSYPIRKVLFSYYQNGQLRRFIQLSSMVIPPEELGKF